MSKLCLKCLSECSKYPFAFEHKTLLMCKKKHEKLLCEFCCWCSIKCCCFFRISLCRIDYYMENILYTKSTCAFINHSVRDFLFHINIHFVSNQSANWLENTRMNWLWAVLIGESLLIVHPPILCVKIIDFVLPFLFISNIHDSNLKCNNQ